MFGSSKAEQFSKVHSELMEKALQLSHDNGLLTAENKALIEELAGKKDEILALNSQIKELQSAQEKMLKTASALGINLSPVIHNDNEIHFSRAISLAGTYIKSEIIQKGIPHFEDALNTDCLKDFMLELPGFVSSPKDSEENREAERQYQYARICALSLLSTK